MAFLFSPLFFVERSQPCFSRSCYCCTGLSIFGKQQSKPLWCHLRSTPSQKMRCSKS